VKEWREKARARARARARGSGAGRSGREGWRGEGGGEAAQLPGILFPRHALLPDSSLRWRRVFFWARLSSPSATLTRRRRRRALSPPPLPLPLPHALRTRRLRLPHHNNYHPQPPPPPLPLPPLRLRLPCLRPIFTSSSHLHLLFPSSLPLAHPPHPPLPPAREPTLLFHAP